MSNQPTEAQSEVLDHLGSIYDGLDNGELSTVNESTQQVPYTTAYQRRKREELLALKMEEEALTNELVRLLKQHQSCAETATFIQNTKHMMTERQWHAQAVLNCVERVRSECTNRKLRALLSEQQKLFASMRKVVAKTDIVTEREFLGRPTADRPFFHLDCSDTVLAELTANLHRLHLEADTAFATLDTGIQVVLHCDTKEHEMCGNLMEMNEITPLAWPVEHAGKFLWDFSTGSNCKQADLAFRHSRIWCPDRWEDSESRNWIMSALFPDPNNTMVRNDSVITFRHYEEDDRVIVVGALSWFFPTEELQFVEEYLTVISPSPVDPDHASVVRTRCQLYTKNMATNTTRKRAMMCSMGNMRRCYLQFRQNLFLEEANPTIVS